MAIEADISEAVKTWRAAQRQAQRELAVLLHVDPEGTPGFEVDKEGAIWVRAKTSYHYLRVRVGRADVSSLKPYEHTIGKLYPVVSWEARPELRGLYEAFVEVKRLYAALSGALDMYRQTAAGRAEAERDRLENLAEFEAKQDKIPGTGWGLYPDRLDRPGAMTNVNPLDSLLTRVKDALISADLGSIAADARAIPENGVIEIPFPESLRRTKLVTRILETAGIRCWYLADRDTVARVGLGENLGLVFKLTGEGLPELEHHVPDLPRGALLLVNADPGYTRVDVRRFYADKAHLGTLTREAGATRWTCDDPSFWYRCFA